MGDIGWFDDAGRLWYCGRKSQRVKTADGTLYPDQVEAVFNTLPGIERTALVGVGDGEIKRPVLCVELPREQRGSAARSEVRARILELATARPELAGIQDVMFHRAFPVDIRHNAKIGREKLAVWATKKLS
jgi:acyl-CoA synthetase (AMP-forming)/AMP-acid ligase II